MQKINDHLDANRLLRFSGVIDETKYEEEVSKSKKCKNFEKFIEFDIENVHGYNINNYCDMTDYELEFIARKIIATVIDNPKKLNFFVFMLKKYQNILTKIRSETKKVVQEIEQEIKNMKYGNQKSLNAYVNLAKFIGELYVNERKIVSPLVMLDWLTYWIELEESSSYFKLNIIAATLKRCAFLYKRDHPDYFEFFLTKIKNNAVNDTEMKLIAEIEEMSREEITGKMFEARIFKSAPSATRVSNLENFLDEINNQQLNISFDYVTMENYNSRKSGNISEIFICKTLETQAHPILIAQFLKSFFEYSFTISKIIKRLKTNLETRILKMSLDNPKEMLNIGKFIAELRNSLVIEKIPQEKWLEQIENFKPLENSEVLKIQLDVLRIMITNFFAHEKEIYMKYLQYIQMIKDRNTKYSDPINFKITEIIENAVMPEIDIESRNTLSQIKTGFSNAQLPENLPKKDISCFDLEDFTKLFFFNAISNKFTVKNYSNFINHIREGPQTNNFRTLLKKICHKRFKFLIRNMQYADESEVFAMLNFFYLLFESKFFSEQEMNKFLEQLLKSQNSKIGKSILMEFTRLLKRGDDGLEIVQRATRINYSMMKNNKNSAQNNQKTQNYLNPGAYISSGSKEGRNEMRVFFGESSRISNVNNLNQKSNFNTGLSTNFGRKKIPEQEAKFSTNEHKISEKTAKILGKAAETSEKADKIPEKVVQVTEKLDQTCLKSQNFGEKSSNFRQIKQTQASTKNSKFGENGQNFDRKDSESVHKSNKNFKFSNRNQNKKSKSVQNNLKSESKNSELTTKVDEEKIVLAFKENKPFRKNPKSKCKRSTSQESQDSQQMFMQGIQKQVECEVPSTSNSSNEHKISEKAAETSEKADKIPEKVVQVTEKLDQSCLKSQLMQGIQKQVECEVSSTSSFEELKKPKDHVKTISFASDCFLFGNSITDSEKFRKILEILISQSTFDEHDEAWLLNIKDNIALAIIRIELLGNNYEDSSDFVKIFLEFFVSDIENVQIRLILTKFLKALKTIAEEQDSETSASATFKSDRFSKLIYKIKKSFMIEVPENVKIKPDTALFFYKYFIENFQSHALTLLSEPRKIFNLTNNSQTLENKIVISDLICDLFLHKVITSDYIIKVLENFIHNFDTIPFSFGFVTRIVRNIGALLQVYETSCLDSIFNKLSALNSIEPDETGNIDELLKIRENRWSSVNNSTSIFLKFHEDPDIQTSFIENLWTKLMKNPKKFSEYADIVEELWLHLDDEFKILIVEFMKKRLPTFEAIPQEMFKVSVQQKLEGTILFIFELFAIGIVDKEMVMEWIKPELVGKLLEEFKLEIKKSILSYEF